MARWVNGAILALLPLASAWAQAPFEDNGNNPFRLEDALAAGRFSLELRPRYNRIEESDKAELTRGGTVRAVAGYRSAPFQGLRAVLEAIHTDSFAKNFNDDPSLFATSEYPLLPDPRYTGVNQAYLGYSGDALGLTVGRQVVRLGNQRWVSDNDFRQIPQLFDGVSAHYGLAAGVQVSGAYYGRVRTTSGELDRLRLTLLHAAWNPVEGNALAAYGVLHAQAQNGTLTGFADNSYRVAGVRAEGAVPAVHGVQALYTLDLAEQRPYAGGDARIRASYWRAGAGAGSDAWTLRYDEERKGSNGGQYGLQMPLTDFYGFNGWTLHFFNTPRQGLRDRWITGRYSVGDFTLYAEAHRFRSDFGNIDFGREVDTGVTYTWGEHLVARLQHAQYDPGSGTPDASIRKTWLTLSLTY
jgi:Alginate export